MPDTITVTSLEALAKAVDDAAAGVAKLDGPSRESAEELRAAVEAVHKAGLTTIVRRLRGDDAGRALLYELVDDPLIRMLFSLHGIIRTDTPAGVGAAGEHTRARPAAGQHAGSEQAGGQRSSGGCGCGDQGGGGCGCGHQHGGPQRAGPTLIPIASLRRRDASDTGAGGDTRAGGGALDIWPGGTA